MRKSAQQGHRGAQFAFALFYVSGQEIYGDSESERNAIEWLRQAAGGGNPLAQCSLGQEYFEGAHGVERNYADAAKWYRKAAEQGYASAEYNLGALYWQGKGVPKNDVEAYKWISLAAAQDLAEASEQRDSLAESMSREEIAEGQRLAAAFVPRTEKSPSESRKELFPDNPKTSGTAFFISERGYLLTAFHVVQDANRIVIKTATGTYEANLVKADQANDIALLVAKTDIFDLVAAQQRGGSVFQALPLTSSRNWEQGQSVFTVGFPNIELQGVEPKLTKGEINSLSGIQDDPRQFQISVQVQPGNSGGPLLDDFGNVVGIVTARLSDDAAFRTSGALPQNVNYAVKISYAVPLIESVPALAGKLKLPHPDRERKLEDAVREARAATALILTY